MKTWEEFSRRMHGDAFYACIDSDGVWFDSATRFSTAVHWCAMNAGHYNMSEQEELEFMDKSNCSIVTSATLRKLYEAGLVR